MEWDHLVLTGDLTQLALDSEFELAHRTLEPLLKKGSDSVTVLPGNHDRYVPEKENAYPFDTWFGPFFRNGKSETGPIGTRQLTDVWHMVAWDSAYPSPPLVAAGKVTPETLEATEDWLTALPSGSRVILANHFPLYFKKPYHFKKFHELRDIEFIRTWVARHQSIELYLHGHLHFNWVLQAGEGGHMITQVNSASSTRIPHPNDASHFHRILLKPEGFEIQPLSFE